MRALSSPDFLDLWERGYGLHPVDQGLLALSAALPAESPEGLADWPLGRRNRALVRLRCSCFGPRLKAWTSCKGCAEKLEFELDGEAWGASVWGNSLDQIKPIVVKGRSFRPPTSRDLARTVGAADLSSAIRRLLIGCLMDAADSLEELAEEDLREIGEQMAAADPQAETRLTLHCPECGKQWEESLDIVGFFWAEIEARAKRVLFEIHTLASAYGWSEREILSLSEPRRALYLERVLA
jgi:hypothetical protein